MGTFLRKYLAHKEENVTPRRFKKRCKHSKKVRWATMEDALKVVAELGNIGSAYYCKHCQAFHITRRKV